VKPTEVCQDFDNWVDGNLDAQRQSRFEQHLPQCASCQESLERWQHLELDVMAAELLFCPAEPQPANEVQLSAGRDSQHLKRLPRSGVVSLLGTSAAMVLLSVGFWWYHGTGLGNPGAPSYSVLKFTSSGCPPGVPCLFADPMQSPDHSFRPGELPGTYEGFAHIGFCATGEVCVVQSNVRWP